MKIYGFVTVRTASSRLKEKCLLRFGAGNVLEHIIRRARYFGFEPVVCTTSLAEDNIIQEIADREDCLIYRGNAEDKLQRWLDACDKFAAEAFHAIDADDPFFDGELGQKSFQLLQQGYDIVYPSTKTYVGCVGFSITSDVIRRACAIKKSDDTEMMWNYIEQVPNLRRIELPVPDARVSNIRLTLDYDEDYWMLLTVLRILGPQASWQEVEALFIRNPDLHKINWFRNEQWKKIQEEKGKKANQESA